METVQIFELISGAFLLGCAAMLIVQRIVRGRASVSQSPVVTMEEVEAVVGRITRDLNASIDSFLEEQSEKFDSITSELYWAMNENLITQALALADTGQDASRISEKTGVDMSEIEAIRRFRRH